MSKLRNTTPAIGRPLYWERGRLARTERRQARPISQQAQSPTVLLALRARGGRAARAPSEEVARSRGWYLSFDTPSIDPPQCAPLLFMGLRPEIRAEPRLFEARADGGAEPPPHISCPARRIRKK